MFRESSFVSFGAVLLRTLPFGSVDLANLWVRGSGCFNVSLSFVLSSEAHSYLVSLRHWPLLVVQVSSVAFLALSKPRLEPHSPLHVQC